jgi:hypothetical protein
MTLESYNLSMLIREVLRKGFLCQLKNNIESQVSCRRSVVVRTFHHGNSVFEWSKHAISPEKEIADNYS